MKSLFNLKDFSWRHKNYLTSSQAQEAYKTGVLPFKDTLKRNRYKLQDAPRRVSSGFFSIELNFEEWLKRYHLTIIGE